MGVLILAEDVAAQEPWPCPEATTHTWAAWRNPPPYRQGGYDFPVNPFVKDSGAFPHQTMARFNPSGSPNPWDDTGTVQWFAAGLELSCWTRHIWLFGWVGYTRVEWEYGHLIFRPGRGDGNGDGGCDYWIVDPGFECEDPEGGGGSSGDGSDSQNIGAEGEPDGDGEWICDEYQLSPGCYDVYIDGEYDTTICCD